MSRLRHLTSCYLCHKNERKRKGEERGIKGSPHKNLFHIHGLASVSQLYSLGIESMYHAKEENQKNHGISRSQQTAPTSRTALCLCLWTSFISRILILGFRPSFLRVLNLFEGLDFFGFLENVHFILLSQLMRDLDHLSKVLKFLRNNSTSTALAPCFIQKAKNLEAKVVHWQMALDIKMFERNT